MSTAAIFTILAAGFANAGSAPLTTVLHTPALRLMTEVRSRKEIRKAYHRASRLANPGTAWDPFEAAPELLSLYWEVNHPKALSAGERMRKRRALRAKLERVRDRLKYIRVRAKRDLARERRRARLLGKSSPREGKPASAAGGNGTIANANRLIQLIQSTIAPHTWDVNGGNGRITFLGNPFYVLVVRASGEVHHQIGGILPVLRR